MGLMDFLKPADINAGVEEFRATPGARLVDVRARRGNTRAATFPAR